MIRRVQGPVFCIHGGPPTRLMVNTSPCNLCKGRPANNRLLKPGGASHFVARAPRDRPDGAPRRAKLKGPIDPPVLSYRRETPGELRANTDRIPSALRANSWNLRENPVCKNRVNSERTPGNSELTPRALRAKTERTPSLLRAATRKSRGPTRGGC